MDDADDDTTKTTKQRPVVPFVLFRTEERTIVPNDSDALRLIPLIYDAAEALISGRKRLNKSDSL